MDQARAAMYSDRADFEGGDSCRVFLANLGEDKSWRAGVESRPDRNFWGKLGNLKMAKSRNLGVHASPS